ncbi:hypothetical protein [Palleronia caenipelagi]|uniref:Uncharacterized protein n=1 Tax=Palleronia caenipelagi TaxID=2489174 RepID=A0A547Q716_9RHOB|nr:hypothetical protein [Palleronia caenipelagi]TRD22161.1 hypothetical protein FEV53_05405 [Palleronia caenipelagi]
MPNRSELAPSPRQRKGPRSDERRAFEFREGNWLQESLSVDFRVDVDAVAVDADIHIATVNVQVDVIAVAIGAIANATAFVLPVIASFGGNIVTVIVTIPVAFAVPIAGDSGGGQEGGGGCDDGGFEEGGHILCSVDLLCVCVVARTHRG